MILIRRFHPFIYFLFQNSLLSFLFNFFFNFLQFIDLKYFDVDNWEMFYWKLMMVQILNSKDYLCLCLFSLGYSQWKMASIIVHFYYLNFLVINLFGIMVKDLLDFANFKFTMEFYKVLIYQILVCIKTKVLFI